MKKIQYNGESKLLSGIATKINWLIDQVGQKIDASEKGVANGVATLDGGGKVPSSQLPSYVDDVIEGYYYNDNFYEDSAHTELITPETSKIYVDLPTNACYRWGGTEYVEISSGDGVKSVATGTLYGTYSVNTNGTVADVPIQLTAQQQPASQDLNDYKESGVYYFTSSNPPVNVPVGSNGVLFVIKSAWSVRPLVKQIWMRHGTSNSNDNQTFTRSFNITNNTWSYWHEYVTSKPSTTSSDAEIWFEMNGRNGKAADAQAGTEAVLGETTAVIGNRTASGSNGNSRGNIRIYGTDEHYIRLTTQDTMSDDYRVQLPAKNGILATVDDVPTKTSDLTNDSNFVSDANYVHTDVNFTSAYETKLNGIASGAEVNVQSNWNQTNTSADDYIKNKPTIPTTQSDLTEVRLTNEDLNDVTYPGFYYAAGGNTVANKPTGYNNFGLVVIHNASQSQYTQIISNENGSYRRIKKADSTWTSWAEDKFTDTTYTASGVVSIDANNNITSTAEVNQNTFAKVKVGSTTITADAKQDTLELVQGDNITLTSDASNDKVTIEATDTKVTQTNATGNYDYPILFANATASAGTSPDTAGVRKYSGITINPNKGYIDTTNGVRFHSNVTDHTANFARLYSANTADRRYKLPVDKDNDSELAIVADAEKVKQTAKTDNVDYRVLLSTNANDNTEIGTVNKNANLIYNASTKTLSVDKIIATSTSDASGTSDTKPPLAIGDVTAAHLELDSNEIMAKASPTTTNTLHVNAQGGAVVFNGAFGIRKNAFRCINIGTGTAGSTDGSTYYPAKWTFSNGYDMGDGDVICIKIPVAGHANGVYVSIDGGTTYQPVIISGTSTLGTHYGVGVYLMLMYEANTSASIYPVNGGTEKSSVKGCWRVVNYRDTTYSTMAANEVYTGTVTTAKLARADRLNADIKKLIADAMKWTLFTSFTGDSANHALMSSSYTDLCIVFQSTQSEEAQWTFNIPISAIKATSKTGDNAMFTAPGTVLHTEGFGILFGLWISSSKVNFYLWNVVEEIPNTNVDKDNITCTFYYR